MHRQPTGLPHALHERTLELHPQANKTAQPRRGTVVDYKPVLAGVKGDSPRSAASRLPTDNMPLTPAALRQPLATSPRPAHNPKQQHPHNGRRPLRIKDACVSPQDQSVGSGRLSAASNRSRPRHLSARHDRPPSQTVATDGVFAGNRCLDGALARAQLRAGLGAAPPREMSRAEMSRSRVVVGSQSSV